MKPVLLLMLLAISPPAFAAGLLVSPLFPTTSLGVPHDYTGNGDGFAMGSFDIENQHTAGLVLFDITLTAVGSGDDSTAFSEVALFIDSNANGAYDPGVDTRYGAAYAAYPVDDGSLTFTQTLGFAPGETKRFLVIAKMDGAVTPAYQQGFLTIVSSISATGDPPIGVPTNYFRGAGVINMPTPLRLEYTVAGTGPPYDYSFRLVLDNSTGSWVSGQAWNDLLLFGQAVYGAGGSAPFSSWITNSASYPVGSFTATSWVSASVSGVSYNAPGLYDNVSPYEDWVPASVGSELLWWGTANVFLNEGEMAWSMRRDSGWGTLGSASLEPAYRVGDYLQVVAATSTAVDVISTDTGGGNGFAIGAFDVISHTDPATLSSLTLGASGTGDDSTAFSDIRLFVDTNTNGVYDPGTDTQFGAAYTAYPADDGSLTFSGTLNFAPDESKRVFVVAQLNGSTLATYGQTFDTTVTAISATGFMHSGLPSAVMPGVHISAPTLTVATSGLPVSVLPDAQGPGGIGVAAAEYLITNNSVGTANLDSITVASAGSLYDHSDFSSVALFEDTNSSGDYDAADTPYAGAATAFPSDDGSLTFTQATTFAPGQSRLFFLVVKLNLAQPGDDFWSRVTSLGVSGGTEVAGAPGTLIHGLTILPGVPRIAIERGAAISNGGTDTLSAIPPGVAQFVTYTISNPGSTALNLTGVPLVEITPGANLTSAIVTVQPATSIGAKSMTTFTVGYMATAPGVFDFTVSIASTDSGNSPYTWSVIGTAANPDNYGSNDDGGCSTGTHSGLAWLALFGAIAALGWRVHRRAVPAQCSPVSRRIG